MGERGCLSKRFPTQAGTPSAATPPLNKTSTSQTAMIEFSYAEPEQLESERKQVSNSVFLFAINETS